MNLNRGLVLVVDDHNAGRYLVARTLRGAGFRVLEAENGSDAIVLARREKPELVLLDIHLPDIDGFEVCRVLRSDSETSSMAVVQMSATFESAEYQVKGLEEGADMFLVEPVEPTVLVATVRSMLRLRRAEAQLREYNRRKDEFLATVAHELRNPLAPLLSSLDLLQSGSGDPALWQTSFAIMRRQTEHLIRLVDDLADMSRITQNKLTLKRQLMDLRVALDTAIEAYRGKLEAKNHHFELDLPDEPLMLVADEVRLAQVFGNLVGNSIRYTDVGGHITVAARAEAESIVVTVTDDGDGIAPEDLGRIFDLFVQVTRRGTGLGIGLALASRIVEMHGGTIEAASKGVGKGSVFTVRLPAPAAERQAEDSGKAPKSERGPLGGAARERHDALSILIVDDNVDAADLMAHLLQALGHDVQVAYAGRLALARAELSPPQLIFMDITMPELDGLKAIELIRRRPWSRGTYICTVSGHGSTHAARSLAAGADMHLVKPASLDALNDVIRRARRSRSEHMASKDATTQQHVGH